MQIKTGNADMMWRGSIWTTAGDLCQLGTAWVSPCVGGICFRPWERDISEGELSEVD